MSWEHVHLVHPKSFSKFPFQKSVPVADILYHLTEYPAPRPKISWAIQHILPERAVHLESRGRISCLIIPIWRPVDWKILDVPHLFNFVSSFFIHATLWIRWRFSTTVASRSPRLSLGKRRDLGRCCKGRVALDEFVMVLARIPIHINPLLRTSRAFKHVINVI